MKPIAELEARVAGIPCLVAVYEYHKGSGSMYTAPSDMDFYGWSEWGLLDQRGRPAHWLEAKLTDADRDRIEVMIQEEME